MANKFKEGEVVQLNSGGALMTVQFYKNDEEHVVHCVWMDHNHVIKGGDFYEITLHVVQLPTLSSITNDPETIYKKKGKPVASASP